MLETGIQKYALVALLRFTNTTGNDSEFIKKALVVLEYCFFNAQRQMTRATTVVVFYSAAFSSTRIIAECTAQNLNMFDA